MTLYQYKILYIDIIDLIYLIYLIYLLNNIYQFINIIFQRFIHFYIFINLDLKKRN